MLLMWYSRVTMHNLICLFSLSIFNTVGFFKIFSHDRVSYHNFLSFFTQYTGVVEAEKSKWEQKLSDLQHKYNKSEAEHREKEQKLKAEISVLKGKVFIKNLVLYNAKFLERHFETLIWNLFSFCEKQSSRLYNPVF